MKRSTTVTSLSSPASMTRRGKTAVPAPSTWWVTTIGSVATWPFGTRTTTARANAALSSANTSGAAPPMTSGSVGSASVSTTRSPPPSTVVVAPRRRVAARGRGRRCGCSARSPRPGSAVGDGRPLRRGDPGVGERQVGGRAASGENACMGGNSTTAVGETPPAPSAPEEAPPALAAAGLLGLDLGADAGADLVEVVLGLVEQGGRGAVGDARRLVRASAATPASPASTPRRPAAARTSGSSPGSATGRPARGRGRTCGPRRRWRTSGSRSACTPGASASPPG